MKRKELDLNQANEKRCWALSHLFGSNGVRGVANRDFTVNLAVRLAAICGTILGKEVALGRDYRTTSLMFRDAAVSGLLSVGCNVHDFGVLPTPALQYSIRQLKLNGGLMVTASHNPPKFNGMKVISADGVEVQKNVEQNIEKLLTGDIVEGVPWDKVGMVTHANALTGYVEAILSHVDVQAARKAGFRVSIDPGNGTASLVAPEVAQRLGCKIHIINAKPDGTFPGRDSEPRPDNLGALSQLVISTESDIGVAFDGDADRSMFIDEHGDVLWGDRVVAIVAKDYISSHKGTRLVTPISSSRVVTDVVEEGGGSVILTRVGSVEISRAMLEQDASLGGEETGGVLYGPHQPVRDGCMALALIIDIMQRRMKSLSRLNAELPRYYQAKDRVKCPNEVKMRALEELVSSLKAPRLDTRDGVKMFFEDGSWILVRPSGTEPVFRLYAEASTQDRADKLIAVYGRLIEEVVRGG